MVLPVKSRCVLSCQGGRDGGEGEGTTPGRTSFFFEFFFLEDKISAPDVFSSCSFICRAVSFYGYEIRDMTSKVAGGQAIFE